LVAHEVAAEALTQVKFLNMAATSSPHLPLFWMLVGEFELYAAMAQLSLKQRVVSIFELYAILDESNEVVY
jgi:hypothetical protein